MAAVGQVRPTRVARRRPVAQGTLTQAAGYLTMVVVVFIIGLPLLWLLSAAFKETSEIYIIPATDPPRAVFEQLPRA
jgi:sn-glycerol 3-phosphate transport system permease protein